MVIPRVDWSDPPLLANTPTATRNFLVKQAITVIANMDATKQKMGCIGSLYQEVIAVEYKACMEQCLQLFS